MGLMRLKKMSETMFGKGQPLVWKMAVISEYVVFPGAMIAALIYCPENDPNKRKGNRTFST